MALIASEAEDAALAEAVPSPSPSQPLSPPQIITCSPQSSPSGFVDGLDQRHLQTFDQCCPSPSPLDQQAREQALQQAQDTIEQANQTLDDADGALTAFERVIRSGEASEIAGALAAGVGSRLLEERVLTGMVCPGSAQLPRRCTGEAAVGNESVRSMGRHAFVACGWGGGV